MPLVGLSQFQQGAEMAQRHWGFGFVGAIDPATSAIDCRSMRLLGWAVGLTVLLVGEVDQALSQNIRLDGTLVPARTLIGPVYQIRQRDGVLAGRNLFYSFDRFNLTTGEQANFVSAPDIQNIFSRVTGGSVSLINGLISTQSTSVNFYLINPNGIVFGPNAKLDIGSSTRGSFVATTLDSLVWSNGNQFSAKAPGTTTNLLTLVGDPSGFLASQRTIPLIGGLNTNLAVYSGNSLLLLGGDVGLVNSNLFAGGNIGGRIELAGVQGSGIVKLSTIDNLLSLNLPFDLMRADISLFNSIVNTRASDGGSVSFQGRNVILGLDSRVFVGIANGLGTPTSHSENIDIKATNTVLVQDSLILNNVGVESQGRGGDINITSHQFILQDSQVGTILFGSGRSGNINIQSTDFVMLNGSNIPGANRSNNFAGGLLAQVDTLGIGQAGKITVDTQHLSISNGARVQAATLGIGNAGDIFIQANLVQVLGSGSNRSPSRISTDVYDSAIGEGGNLTIDTQQLQVRDGGQISSSTFGIGKAGNLIVRATNSIDLSGETPGGNQGFPGGIFAQVDLTGRGNGGDLRIETNRLSISNGSKVQVSTFGIGNAGQLLIKANEVNVFNTIDATNTFTTVINASVSLDPRTTTSPRGNGGSLTLQARNLIVQNGGGVETNTQGEGNAGNLLIQADRIEVSGTFPNSGKPSQISSSVENNGSGQGGNLKLESERIIISDGGQLSVSSNGNGKAGEMEITTGSMTLRSESQVLAETISGQGGNITFSIRDFLLLREHSRISTNAGTSQAGGDGGNITIKSLFTLGVLSENSDITANAFTGSGGRVDITAQGIFGLQFQSRLTSFSDITASSQRGANGTVILNTPNVDPSRGLIALPASLVDASDRISQGCNQRSTAQDPGSFYITGRGGLPQRPGDLPLSAYPTGAVQTIPGTTASAPATDNSSATVQPAKASIIEADRLTADPNGNLWLVAQAPNPNAELPWPSGCASAKPIAP